MPAVCGFLRAPQRIEQRVLSTGMAWKRSIAKARTLIARGIARVRMELRLSFARRFKSSRNDGCESRIHMTKSSARGSIRVQFPTLRARSEREQRADGVTRSRLRHRSNGWPPAISCRRVPHADPPGTAALVLAKARSRSVTRSTPASPEPSALCSLSHTSCGTAATNHDQTAPAPSATSTAGSTQQTQRRRAREQRGTGDAEISLQELLHGDCFACLRSSSSERFVRVIAFTS